MFERSNFGPGLRAGFVRQLFGALSLLVVAINPLYANPYLAKPGERPVPIRIATCAVSGGFTHLYAALDNNLFDKYGFKMEHVYIRGSGPSLSGPRLASVAGRGSSRWSVALQPGVTCV